MHVPNLIETEKKDNAMMFSNCLQLLCSLKTISAAFQLYSIPPRSSPISTTLSIPVCLVGHRTQRSRVRNKQSDWLDGSSGNDKRH